jgi:hypothetical protein
VKLVEGEEEASHRRNLTTTIGMGLRVIDKAATTIGMVAAANMGDTPTVINIIVEPVVRMLLDAGSEIDMIGTTEILLQEIGVVHLLAIVTMRMTFEDQEPAVPQEVEVEVVPYVRGLVKAVKA